VAIVQVSRITQRKGLQEDLPQPLASAELGWAIDQRRLFIGNGTTEEGAPVVGNTEILTEYSDILSFSATYTYKGEAAGYTVQTGSSPGTPVTQSLQSRLDSFAVVTDFGATGDGVTDDTAAINRALYQLYCVQVNAQVRRGLFFPAGVYKITNTILIPPYARLYGDGSDSSSIVFSVDTWTSGTAYSDDVLVKDVDGSGDVNYYRSVANVPALVNGSPIPLTDTDYWLLTTLPNYAVNTSDSLQQTGSNIGLNGAVPPQYIELEGLALSTQEFVDDSSLGHNLMLLDRINNSSFNQVSFSGALTTTELTNAAENLVLVSVDSTPSLPVKSITFDQCSFHNATYAFNTDNLTQGITVSNSMFDTLYKGIVLGDSAPVNGGPTGFRIMHNTFDNIYAEGVVIDSCSLNATGYNTFYDVGNHFNGVTSPAAPCVLINADDNISVGDMFQRTDAYSNVYPRIQLWNVLTSTIPSSMAYTSAQKIQLGSFQRQVGQQATIVDAAVNQTLFTVDITQSVDIGGFASFRMDYTIYRDTTATKGVRTGTLVVCGSPGADSAGETLVFTDDYIENETCDVTLLVSEDSNDIITVAYNAGSTGYSGTIYYSISSLG
jgi:hypothetical protein